MLLHDSLDAYLAAERQRNERLEQSRSAFGGPLEILDVLGPALDQDKHANTAAYSITRPVGAFLLDALGINGDRHRRAIRPSTARERLLYEKGTLIREHRHVFVVSPYDCAALSERLGVGITPALLGANLVIGRSDGTDVPLSHLPPGTHFLLAPSDATQVPRPPLATLVHYVLQQGCGVTGHTIATRYDDPTLTKRFVAASKTNRGLVCSVEYPVERPLAVSRGMRVFMRYPSGISP